MQTSKQVLLRDSPQGFVIFPEGTTPSEDRMVKARSGGTLTLIEAAVDNKVPLAVLPVALNQKTVWRGETVGKDRYEIRTGAPRRAVDLLPPNYRRGKVEARREVMDSIMIDIAKMMPEEKRGDYAQAVEERRRDIDGSLFRTPKEHIVFAS